MSALITHAILFAHQNIFLAYFVIYLATIFIGNVSAFASFWFIVQGYLGPWGVPFLIITIFLANVSGDIIWYTLGRSLRNTRFGNWVKLHIPGYERAEALAVRRGHHLMFFAKFIYASSFPLVFSLGWTHMPVRKFIRSSAIAALLWLPVLLVLFYGVFAGLSPLAATAAIKHLELLFISALLLFLVLNYVAIRIVRMILIKNRT